MKAGRLLNVMLIALFLAGAASLGLSRVSGAEAPGQAGRIVMDSGGASAWVLSREGSLEQIEIATGRPLAWPHDAGDAPFSDIAISRDGRTLYALIPASGGRATSLVALDVTEHRETARWEVRGLGRLLEVAPDGARACVVGLKPSAGGNPAGAGAEDWTLTLVETATGAISGPILLGLEPRALAWLDGKLFIGARDRVVTYGLDPLRSSWFYRSPGENIDIAGVAGSPVLYVLRDHSLAIIDPSRRPRSQGRVQLSEDDATSVVALPSRGRAMALTSDGRLAAVLHEDGAGVTLVDAVGGVVIGTEEISAPRDLIGRLIAGDPPRLMLASSRAGAGAATAMGIPPPPDHVPAPRQVETPRPVEAPRPVEPMPSPAPQSEPEPASPEKPEHPSLPLDPEPAPPAAPVEASPPPAEPPPAAKPERASAQTVLAGTVSGDRSGALQVLLYGPDSILKLHSRTVVAQDGTFRVLLPPPGSYRVVVSGGAGAHLFTRPEFRTIQVKQDGTGVEGIDFEVRGRL